jgi:imidazolonepropionase-like amidohydrolase
MRLVSLVLLATLASAESLVLKRANAIDGVSAEPHRNVNIVITDGKISSIGASEGPANATVIDLNGRWVLPGYVDAHVHITNLAAARAALRSGVTTARSMGVSSYVDLGIRELHRSGLADIPEIVAAGYHVRPRPADEMFFDFPKLLDLMKGAAGPANVRRLVRANLDRGVQVIKIMATERAGLPDTDPRQRVFTDEELSAAVDEARSRNIPIAAHAHGEEGAAAAVRAGVSSIEHGTYLSDTTLQLMKQRGTFFDPTIATVVDLVEPGGDYDNPVLAMRGRHMLPRVRETTSHAWKIGVKIVAGTDTGYGPQSIRRIPHEITELVAIGMPPMEAIKAGTSVAADCAGVGGRTGSLRAGYEADLIVIERNPLEDLNSLMDVLLVLNDGKIAVNRLKW